MPLLFQYLLKLSCTLALVYLFYQLVLRRLTFYSANRWYLLLYSAAAFAIPFINISRFIETRQLSHAAVVQAIPTLETYTGSQTAIVQKSSAAGFAIWDGCLMVFFAGIFVLAFRLFVQYVSYRRIRNGAQLIAADGVNLYQTAEAITPFSFGNSIFINQQGHSEAELSEIIRHEFVHVRQRHTLDIVWMELLCLLNWYNPAAWLLRHAARQNLEFIADSKVLQSGVDNKAYQYLLLKVMGAPQFRLATSFNFSSLKKRIVMMNKMQSTKAHLVKFLFVLPLLAVLLLAFRDKLLTKTETGKTETVAISCIVIDATTETPIPYVSVHESYTDVQSTTDSRGFFSISVPVKKYPAEIDIILQKPGFKTTHGLMTLDMKMKDLKSALGIIQIRGMIREDSMTTFTGFVSSRSVYENDDKLQNKMTYDAALKIWEEDKAEARAKKKLVGIIKDSEKPYWIVDGHSFIVSEKFWQSLNETVSSIFVDGEHMTGEELNKRFKRTSFHNANALTRDHAKVKYGIDQPVFEIFIKTVNPVGNMMRPLVPWEGPISDTAVLSATPPVQVVDTPKLPAGYKAS